MTGSVHPREFLSLSSHIFFITRIIYLAQRQDADILDLLKRTNLYFIPVVNVDGLHSISTAYREKKVILSIRKNRHNYSESCDSTEGIGVDLNRNFAAGFGSTGASWNPCDEEFRGPNAFSEPETLVIKKFVDSHQNIKFAIDIHAYGNDYVLPSQITRTNMKGTEYEEFYKEAELDSSHKFGTCQEILGYITSGDVSDWIVGEKNIPAFSLEIGAEETFTPASPRAIRDLV